MPLFIDTGFSSARGASHDNESCLMVAPDTEDDLGHGALVAIADGVADRPAPEDASRDALKTLGDHYYTAPENWGLKHALQESAAAANHVLVATGEQGRAASLSVLALRRRRWAIAHAGNTRAWLIRDSEIKLLTSDHVAPRMTPGQQIERACGISRQLEADFITGELQEGDVFVLTNAEAHGALTSPDILACVVADTSARQTATTIIERARRAGARGGADACVVRIEQVPPESREDIEEDIAALPAIAPPEVGDELDGFRVERLTHKSSRYRLYKAIDTQDGQIVALKFPNPRDAAEPGFAENFLREEWIGRRVTSAHLLRTLPLKKGRRTVLYSVMAYPSGENLAKRLARKGALTLRETAFVGGELLEGLGQLHDQGIIHSDVRPQNIVLEQKSGNLMLLGLGSSHVPNVNTSETLSGRPSRRANFLAPELFNPGPEPTIRSDIYATGVTLYRMLTGKYPYGKVSSTGTAPRGEFQPIDIFVDNIPEQIDSVLRRACALDPNERFETAHEFSEALDAAMAEQSPAAVSGQRRPVLRWSWEVAAAAALAIVLVVYLFYVLRG